MCFRSLSQGQVVMIDVEDRKQIGTSPLDDWLRGRVAQLTESSLQSGERVCVCEGATY